MNWIGGCYGKRLPTVLRGQTPGAEIPDQGQPQGGHPGSGPGLRIKEKAPVAVAAAQVASEN